MEERLWKGVVGAARGNIRKTGEEPGREGSRLRTGEGSETEKIPSGRGGERKLKKRRFVSRLCCVVRVVCSNSGRVLGC